MNILKNIRALPEWAFQIFEPAAGKIRDAYGQLAPRERTLVLAAIACAVVFASAIVVLSIRSSLRELEANISMQSDILRKIIRQRNDYLRDKAELERVKKRLQSNSASLFSFLEETAKTVGAEISDINDRGVSGNTRNMEIREETVDVSLGKITVDKLADFLFRIENNPAEYKIRKLRMRTRPNEKLLDASFSVASYKVNTEVKGGTDTRPGRKPVGAPK